VASALQQVMTRTATANRNILERNNQHVATKAATAVIARSCVGNSTASATAK